MTTHGRHRIVATLVLTVSLSLIGSVELLAEPIGLVTISSDSDAEVARSIVGTAYIRSSNRFLVTADLVQQGMLSSAGLEFELLLEEADPAAVYQIYALDHPKAPMILDLEAFGRVIELGRDIRIMQLTRAEAASVADDAQLETVSLSELSVPIFYPHPVVAAPLVDTYPSDSLTNRVNQDSLRAFVQRLEDFRTRYTYTDSCLRARDWIAQKFRDWGYTDVTTPAFYYGGAWHYNVKAVKPGVAEPDKVIVIGGHYDSYVRSDQSPGRFIYAPGADDDGSGTALTLEAARVLANVPLRKTVIFMPFGAEEIGLVGSQNASADFVTAGTKLEVMYNFDMVAFTANSYWDFEFSSGDITAYRDFSIASAVRVSDLIPVTASAGSSSDHYPFDQRGFPIVNHIESDFNTLGWHTNLDLTSRLNIPYFAEVTKTAVASLAVVADAAFPARITSIADVGDGQSLEVVWSDCNPGCQYTVYWGSAPGNYTDSVVAPVGQCDVTITGLLTGQTAYILALGVAPNGYRALYGVGASGTPLLYPRAPSSFSGSPHGSQMRVDLTWRSNNELDLSHYRLYRRVRDVGVWLTIQDGITDTSATDYDLTPHVGYQYAVAAVDNDGYESPMSQAVLIYPATYDGGPVIGDGFVKDHDDDPTQAQQEAWLDTILGTNGFGVAPSDEYGGPVTLSTIGQYGTLLWIDDDVIVKNIAASAPALDEFSQHGTNMLISGFRTWYGWSAKSVPTSHLLYREFGLSYYDYTAQFDFIGAFGQDGWPSVQIDPTRGVDEWRDIAKLTGRPGAQVILRFNSLLDLPEWENQPVGLAYETANGKRVLLSFPLYYLTPASATALMTKVFEYFGVSAHFNKGDLDNSGTIDVVDITILIDHLFISQSPLPDPSAAEMDANPGVSIGDVFVLIEYLFLGGPAPSARP
ncbi:MAG: M20/M25/M40 family metallo-hydrolase [Candidatus Zixiibacteriota bacterium]